MGNFGYNNLLVKDGGDNWAYVYLVTYEWALINLELSRAGNVEMHYNGTYSTAAPGGTTLYQLSDDFANNTHPNTLKMKNGVLQARYDHQNRFVVQNFLISDINIPAFSDVIIAKTKITVPSGKELHLRRVRWHLTNSNLRPRVDAGFIWTGSTINGDVAINGVFVNFEPSSLLLIIINNAPNTQSVPSGSGIWAEFEIR